MARFKALSLLMLAGLTVGGALPVLAQPCSQTLSPGANVASAVSSAPGNSVICLNGGNYGSVELEDIRRSTFVTVQPVSGATVVMSPIIDSSSFVRLKGMRFNGAQLLSNTSHHIEFIDDTWVPGGDGLSLNGLNDNPPATPQEIIVDGCDFTDVSIALWDGRLNVRGMNGVKIRNTVIGGTGNSGEKADGIMLIGGSINTEVGPGNEFRNFRQADAQQGEHIDAIQIFGAGSTGNRIFGNYFHDSDVFIGAFDAVTGITVEHNVFDATGLPSRTEFQGVRGLVYRHNTWRGTMATPLVDNPKAGDQPNSNNTIENNVFADGASPVVRTCSGCTVDSNLFESGSGVGTNRITGSPVFTGGSNPSSYQGHALASGSAGKAAGNDGLDVGIAISGDPQPQLKPGVFTIKAIVVQEQPTDPDPDPPGGEMPSSHRSISSTTYASRTNTTVTAPAGIQNDDILLLAFYIGISGTPPTPTLPSGFTILQGPSTVVDGGGFQLTRRLAYKLASSESGNYTITHSNASSQAVMVVVQGGDKTVAPLSTNNAGEGLTTTALGLTTTVNDSYVAFIVHNWSLYGAASPPTGTTPTFTERLDATTSLVYVADGVLATAGATGDKTHSNTNTGGGSFRDWGAFLVSVPASTGADTTLSADGQADATGTADVATAITAAASGTAEVVGSATLQTAITLEAAGQAEATGAADLTAGNSELEAAGQGTATGVAALETAITLAASGEAVSDGAGALQTAITFEASGLATADGLANLFMPGVVAGLIVGDIAGPSIVPVVATGPELRRVFTGAAVARAFSGAVGTSPQTAGPALSRLVTGPAQAGPEFAGPAVSRTLDGPAR